MGSAGKNVCGAAVLAIVVWLGCLTGPAEAAGGAANVRDACSGQHCAVKSLRMGPLPRASFPACNAARFGMHITDGDAGIDRMCQSDLDWGAVGSQGGSYWYDGGAGFITATESIRGVGSAPLTIHGADTSGSNSVLYVRNDETSFGRPEISWVGNGANVLARMTASTNAPGFGLVQGVTITASGTNEIGFRHNSTTLLARFNATGLKFEGTASPVACAAGTDGQVTYNTTRKELSVCDATAYRTPMLVEKQTHSGYFPGLAGLVDKAFTAFSAGHGALNASTISAGRVSYVVPLVVGVGAGTYRVSFWDSNPDAGQEIGGSEGCTVNCTAAVGTPVDCGSGSELLDRSHSFELRVTSNGCGTLPQFNASAEIITAGSN